MGEISEALRRSRQSPPPKADAPSSRAVTPAPASTPPTPVPEAYRVEIARGSDSCPARVIVTDGQSGSAEAARHLALRLRRELEARGARSIGVVSSERSEGKTTVACNLALALASLTRGRTVALVDLDLRSPSVAVALGISLSRGIDDALRGTCSLGDARVEIEKPSLDVYPARVPEPNEHELLVRPTFAPLLREFEQRYEITVFDTPPMLLVPDGSVIVERVGAAVAVSRAGRTRLKAFEKMLELLPPAKLIGTVLNEGKLPSSQSQYGYYGVPGTE